MSTSAKISDFFSKSTTRNNNSNNEDEQEEEVKEVPEVPDLQFRPCDKFVFPKKKLGSRYRSCQHKWFADYQWLHYDKK